MMTQDQKLEIMELFEASRRLRDELHIHCIDCIDDEADLHSRVAAIRRDLGRLDIKLFSIYALLHKYRAQNHYNQLPNTEPLRKFTLDDL